MLVGWTFTRTLTPVLMKLSERWPKYAYGHIAFLLSTTFLSTGAKVLQEQKLNGTKVVCGSNVPQVRKFHGIKVLGTFAPKEQKFQGCKSSMERKFSDFSLPVSDCTTAREFSLFGLFAPGNKSAEERKVQIPSV